MGLRGLRGWWDYRLEGGLDWRYLDDGRVSMATHVALGLPCYGMHEPEGPLAKQIALRNRTRDFALEVARMCNTLTPSMAGRHVAGQMIRCCTSIAANYRAACRAKSRRDFVSKIGIVLEEADEAYFWLEFARDLDLLKGDRVEWILSESNQLVAIFAATRSTARANLRPVGARSPGSITTSPNQSNQ